MELPLGLAPSYHPYQGCTSAIYVLAAWSERQDSHLWGPLRIGAFTVRWVRLLPLLSDKMVGIEGFAPSSSAYETAALLLSYTPVNGAGGRTRTHSLRIRIPMLFYLSYASKIGPHCPRSLDPRMLVSAFGPQRPESISPCPEEHEAPPHTSVARSPSMPVKKWWRTPVSRRA